MKGVIPDDDITSKENGCGCRFGTRDRQFDCKHCATCVYKSSTAIHLNFQMCTSLCAFVTTEYLKDNKYTGAELAFTEECPYILTDDEARPSESLEEIVAIYRKQKQSGELWYGATRTCVRGKFAHIHTAPTPPHDTPHYLYHLSLSTADCEWEECGQGQVLNNLCTKLQSCVEDIK